jgi:hypothetical protein
MKKGAMGKEEGKKELQSLWEHIHNKNDTIVRVGCTTLVAVG